MTGTLEIRYGTIDDAARLADFGARAFFDAFARDNTEQNIHGYLTRTYSPEIQAEELSNPSVLFLVAEMGDAFVGYAKLNLDSKSAAVSGDRAMEIERIYAAREHIGKGIGRALMEAAIREARKRSCKSLWLGVWERNPRAIAFYEKWGFREVGEHTFMLGDEPQRDLIMELRLESP